MILADPIFPWCSWAHLDPYTICGRLGSGLSRHIVHNSTIQRKFNWFCEVLFKNIFFEDFSKNQINRFSVRIKSIEDTTNIMERWDQPVSLYLLSVYLNMDPFERTSKKSKSCADTGRLAHASESSRESIQNTPQNAVNRGPRVLATE